MFMSILPTFIFTSSSSASRAFVKRPSPKDLTTGILEETRFLVYIYIYPLEGFPIKGGMTLPNIYVIMYLAILLVTFFGMVKNVTLSRGEK